MNFSALMYRIRSVDFGKLQTTVCPARGRLPVVPALPPQVERRRCGPGSRAPQYAQAQSLAVTLTSVVVEHFAAHLTLAGDCPAAAAKEASKTLWQLIRRCPNGSAGPLGALLISLVQCHAKPYGVVGDSRCARDRHCREPRRRRGAESPPFTTIGLGVGEDIGQTK